MDFLVETRVYNLISGPFLDWTCKKWAFGAKKKTPFFLWQKTEVVLSGPSKRQQVPLSVAGGQVKSYGL